jgi:hypothetical protein
MNLSDFLAQVAHALSHLTSGDDEIDADQLDIDFTPSNYTPSTTPSEVSNVDHLGAHLAGIDDELGGLGGISSNYFEDIARKQTLLLGWKDADEIYVYPGAICVDDGDVNPLECTATITKQLTSLSSSTFYYIYVDTPASGSTLAAADIEYSNTAPVKDTAKKGYYHPTTTDWRCIGAILTDGSGNIKRFDQIGNYVYYNQPIEDDHTTEDPGTSWTDQLLTVPLWTGDYELPVGIFQFIGQRPAAARVGWVRVNGSSDDGIQVTEFYSYTEWTSVEIKHPTDNSGYVETKFSATGTGQAIYITTKGFMLPELIYNGS